MSHELLSFRELRRRGRNIRLHGNGFIQIDLDAHSHHRVHLWHDGLVPRAQAVPTPVHDHTFWFRSYVLAGCLVNQEFEVAQVPCRWHGVQVDIGTHHVYAATRREGQDTRLARADDHAYVARPYLCARSHRAPSPYEVPAGTFHASLPVGYAITRFEREPEGKGVPRVLVPVGLQPDNEFHRYRYGEELWDVVEAIYRQLPECTA